ncbi:MAG TPA: hypothetical protein VMA83_09620 [Solirubrobacteraceae bacterium]|nr:hypothetical protein [Solirubrobacteraceae bacterium]
MGRRSRRRRDGQTAKQPPVEYADGEGNVLALRCTLSAASRVRYAETLAGSPLSIDDARERAMELLFEQLAAGWTIAGAPLERQRDLLARLRAASREEREWVRRTLRAHCAEYFPDVDVA